jgi:hypothetical protein
MRISLTSWLVVVLVIAAGYAAWTWWRPYDWRPDAGARYRITGVAVTRDHANHWVEVHLKRTGTTAHDLTKPVRLMVGSGRELAPADTRLAGGPEQGMTELTFKFWLDPGELAEPLRLRLNDGVLWVKKTRREPALGAGGRRFFNSSNW